MVAVSLKNYWDRGLEWAARPPSPEQLQGLLLAAQPNNMVGAHTLSLSYYLTHSGPSGFSLSPLSIRSQTFMTRMAKSMLLPWQLSLSRASGLEASGLGLGWGAVYPTSHSRWAINTIMATPPRSPSTSRRDCKGEASLNSSGNTDTVAT